MEVQTKSNKIKYMAQYLDLCKKLNDLGFDLSNTIMKQLLPKQLRKFNRIKKEVLNG